ncbi:MAG: hypothetical protein JWR18_1407 [Segetibacter sp.]|jgi:hypothetical protein|nr:hypothetical protein [Segetibacter sp.]
MENKKLITTTANEALTPAELIKKHNSNPNHIITENEMRNLKVGNNAEDNKELNREIEEKEAEDNCDNHENNPYDILNA